MNTISKYSIAFLLLATAGYGQAVAWERTQDISINNLVLDVSTDEESNSYQAVSYANGGRRPTETGLQIVKSNPQGHEIWRKILSSKLSHFVDMASDRFGNLYVCLNILQPTNLDGTMLAYEPPYTNAILVKFDKNGLIQWHKRHVLTKNAALSVEKDGAVVIIAEKYDAATPKTGESLAGSYLTRYTSQGEQQWEKKIGGLPAPSNLILGKDNNLYVGMMDKGEFVVSAYDDKGSFVRGFNPKSPGLFVADEQGNIYLAGANTLVKLSANNEKLWEIPLTSVSYPQLAIDTANNIYFSGGYDMGENSGKGVFVAKVNSDDGNEIWRYNHQTGTTGCKIDLDKASNLYLYGRKDEGEKHLGLVLKLNQK